MLTPSLDDPASPFNPNYQLCKGRPQRNAGQRQRGRGLRAKLPRGSLRCRKSTFVSLEHMWAQQPSVLWTMLREALFDAVDARIRRAAAAAAPLRGSFVHSSQQVQRLLGEVRALRTSPSTSWTRSGLRTPT